MQLFLLASISFLQEKQNKKKNTAAHLIEGICLEGTLMV